LLRRLRLLAKTHGLLRRLRLLAKTHGLLRRLRLLAKTQRQVFLHRLEAAPWLPVGHQVEPVIEVMGMDYDTMLGYHSLWTPGE